jgi:hypothetical protein
MTIRLKINESENPPHFKSDILRLVFMYIGTG